MMEFASFSPIAIKAGRRWVSAVTFNCGHDNLKSFPCILLKFVMHIKMTSSHLKSFPCILIKFVLHVTNKQFSNKFYNG